jgi:stage V sporulation protein R
MPESLPKWYIDELNDAIDESAEIALRLGLDPFHVHYQILPSDMLYEIAGYSMPGRFKHWSFGKSYARQKLMYDYGLSKIYELIINTNPCQAFLLDTNTVTQNKLIIAHCLGHSDFFKNNAYFAGTNRHMSSTMEMHAGRIHQYEYDHGEKRIEALLDAVLSIGFHIDSDLTISDLHPPKRKSKRRPKQGDYDDLWSRDVGDDEDDEPEEVTMSVKTGRTPSEPIADLLLFIHEFSHTLDDWERDILLMMRDEHRYFMPQIRTKICNEGWATFWHTRIMREMSLRSEEFIEFAAMHAGIARSHTPNLNPYHLGFAILEDIEKRFGMDELFMVRETQNDVSLIRNYLTEELVHELDLLVAGEHEEYIIVVDRNWETVKQELIDELTAFQPRMFVADGDFTGNGSLLLLHAWDGYPLKESFTKRTLEYIYRLWGRTVFLQTRQEHEKKPVMLSYHPSTGHRQQIGMKLWDVDAWEAL